MKTKNLFIAGMVGILLTACTSETAMEEKTLGKSGHGSLKVEVSDGVTATATRANYSGFPATTFETDDAIGMYVFDGSSYVVNNIRFVKQSDGSWEPDEEVPYNEDYTFYAYFPYRATAYAPSASGTVDDIDTKFAAFIEDENNYFWQANQSTKAGFTYSNLMIAKGTVTDTDEESATVKFVMKHKRGLAVFTDDATEASFSGNIPYLVGSTMLFLMKPDVATSFTDDTGTYSLTSSPGEYMSHSIILPTIDLSMVDNAGTARATMTTANCYLVHAAGKYKLPLVYGNAIKNDTVNTVAYAPGGSTTTTYCANFINHAGTDITGPWITKCGTGVDAGMGLTAASAELLWQDAAGLISSVSVDGDYLKFTVGTFTGGNALIAVKDGSGTILWSWHIWATENDLSNTTVVSTTGHDYTVAPVNLGWVPTGGDGKQGYCPYYQWGRKDPFIPATAYDSNTNHTVYNISGTTVIGIYFSETGVTIAENIKNPTYLYSDRSNHIPVTTNYYNMWDAQNTATGNVATATKKTIYDPCPPGFCVPTSNLCYYFGNNNKRTMATWDNTNKGAIWDIGITGNALWFPASGLRAALSGNVVNIGSFLYFYSATPYSSYNCFYLYGNTNQWQYTNTSRASGMTVRPVAEE